MFDAARVPAPLRDCVPAADGREEAGRAFYERQTGAIPRADASRRLEAAGSPGACDRERAESFVEGATAA